MPNVTASYGRFSYLVVFFICFKLNLNLVSSKFTDCVFKRNCRDKKQTFVVIYGYRQSEFFNVFGYIYITPKY